MKVLVGIFVFIILSANAFSYEINRAKVNQAQELAECAAFYMYAAEGVKRNGDLRLYEDLIRSAGVALELSELFSNHETTIARFTIAMQKQGETIGNDLSNISRLILNYLDVCKVAISDPSARYKYWLEQ